MKWKNKIRTLAAIGLFSVLPCTAQELAGWHLRSTIGFDVSGNSFTPISNSTSANSTPSSVIGGELAMDLSGMVLDPKFITFNSNFSFMHGANSVNQLDYSNGVLGGGANVNFLPNSHYPLEVFYQRTGADTSGSLFGSNSDTSQFRARWTIDRLHVPRLVFTYADTSNDVRLVTSLANTGYKQSDWSVQANDQTAGWIWNAGFNVGSFTETSFGSLSLGSDTKDDYKTVDAQAYRAFWSGKAVFNSGLHYQHYFFTFPGSGTTLTDNLLLSNALQIQHTRKLSSRYTYSWSHLTQSNDLAASLGTLTVVVPPTMNTQSVGSEVDYQLAGPIRVFQGVQYQHLTPFSGTAESETSLLESSSGVNVMKRWRGFDLSATYTGMLETLGTSFGNRGNTWSNNVDTRVGWGDVKKLHLTGTYRHERLNLVQEIGGFSQFNSYGLQAETTRFWAVRLSGGVEHGTVELLNISGDTSRTYTNYVAQLEHRRFHLLASRGLNDGSGSIFPTTLTGAFYIAVPLPVSQLIATPLLNVTSQSTNFGVTGRPRNNLEIGAYYRKENDTLITSNQNYRLWEIRAQYKIGKISVDGGFGNIHSAITQDNSLSGLGINRYWFRIRRSFNFF